MSGHGWFCALVKIAHNNSAESIEKVFIDVIFEVKRSVRDYPELDRSMEIQEMGGFKKRLNKHWGLLGDSWIVIFNKSEEIKCKNIFCKMQANCGFLLGICKL